MYLYELTAYAEKKYNIAEEYKWKEYPTFSVLAHPVTGKWVALLMRQWDTDRGEEIELCDLRCGRERSDGECRPYISAPFRMRGPMWTGIRFDRDTDTDAVLKLFDRAIKTNEERGYTVVLGSKPEMGTSAAKHYIDTPIPLSRRSTAGRGDTVPDRIRELKSRYRYTGGSFFDKCVSFRRQAEFMADYEDDYPWELDYTQYFPTYHDLRPDQLRGYFAWRTKVRKGEYRPIAGSLAYIFIYELINGIGSSSPEDTLSKMSEFSERFIGAGFGDEGMRKNIRKWMFDTCVVKDLPPETAALYAEPDKLAADRSLIILRDPVSYNDEEVFDALCTFGGDKWRSSPVIEKNGEEGIRLFADVWRYALAHTSINGKNLFRLCFGDRHAYRWYPFGNAVYGFAAPRDERVYELSSVRRYSCAGGTWKETAYHKVFFDLKWLKGLMHETDRLLRQYLGAGRSTKAKEDEAWATSSVTAVIEADRRAKIEAARPKVEINFGDLDKIRRDSYITRDSLLTEEDIIDETGTDAETPSEDILTEVSADDNITEEKHEEESAPGVPTIPLTDLQTEILKRVLSGESVRAFLAERHEMPEIAADSINEILFEEIGDSAVDCDGEDITLIEDYREDVMRILGER